MTDKFDFKKGSTDDVVSRIDMPGYEEEMLQKAIADGLVDPKSPSDVEGFKHALENFKKIVRKVEGDFSNTDKRLEVLAELATAGGKMLDFPNENSTADELRGATMATTQIFGELTGILGKMCAEGLRLQQDETKSKEDIAQFDAGIQTAKFIVDTVVLPALERFRKEEKKKR